MGLLKLVIFQVLVAALLLVSFAAFVKRYPDPLDCRKYYLRIDTMFYPLTCPNNLTFNQYMQECTKGLNEPNITPLNGTNCNQGKEGYYCNSSSYFTYCTHDGLKIINNAMCPYGRSCAGTPNTNPCVPYNCSV